MSDTSYVPGSNVMITVPPKDLSQPWFCLWFVTCYLFVSRPPLFLFLFRYRVYL